MKIEEIKINNEMKPPQVNNVKTEKVYEEEVKPKQKVKEVTPKQIAKEVTPEIQKTVEKPKQSEPVHKKNESIDLLGDVILLLN